MIFGSIFFSKPIYKAIFFPYNHRRQRRVNVIEEGAKQRVSLLYPARSRLLDSL